MAKSAMAHSGQFGANSPTRSPGLMPSSPSTRDIPATRRNISFAEMDSQPTLVRNICARGFAYASTASRKHFGMAGYSAGIAVTLAHCPRSAQCGPLLLVRDQLSDYHTLALMQFRTK